MEDRQGENSKLRSFLFKKSYSFQTSKPEFFNLQNRAHRIKLSKLIKEKKIQNVIDDYQEQQKEYFSILNPKLVYRKNFQDKFSHYLNELQEKIPLWQQGNWVYFPWLFTIIHILEGDLFQIVRTARNRNLINKEEQAKFYNSVVGIAGLSVGNSIALSIVLQGGGCRLRITDHDHLSLSNLNRICSGVEFLGLSKAEMTARQIYTLNPYNKIELFPRGLTKENISEFFAGPPVLDIIIDEVDNLAVKCLIREQAKKFGVPVVMGADNGDGAVIDVERYDQDPNLEFFHGRLGKVSYEKLSHLDKFGIGRMITKHIGMRNVSQRMQKSLLEMGKTIVSWPQLGGAAILNGSAVAYCVRKILNGEPLQNNRTIISLDEKFIPDHNSNR